MERFSFAADAAFTPRDELLDGVTIAPLSAPVSERAPFQAAVFRFAPGGRIARHRPAGSGTQILAVLEGKVAGLWPAQLFGVLSPLRSARPSQTGRGRPRPQMGER